MFPLIAYADGAGPEIVSYDAYVINPNGAPQYDWDLKKKGTIDYEKKLRIYNEYTMDCEIYGVIEDKNSDDEKLRINKEQKKLSAVRLKGQYVIQ